MKGSNNWQRSSQRLKGSFVRFIAWVTHGSFPRQQTYHPVPIPTNIYHHCNDTPLSVFIACLCDHKLNTLIRYGKAKPPDLVRAWEMIYGEYSDTSGNAASRVLIGLTKDIAYHVAKRDSVALCLKVLTHWPDPRAIKVLREYGYNYTYDFADPIGYSKDLDMVATRWHSIVMTIQLKEAELRRESKHVQGKPMTRDTFLSILATLSEHFHLAIREFEQDTVSAFVAYRKKYEGEMVAISRQVQKSKSHG